MKKKILVLAAVAMLSVFSLTACKAADVVGKVAGTSFGEVVDKMASSVAYDDANKSWALKSPSGERFLWSKDFSATDPDLMLEFDAQPFLDAGLDADKLPSDMYLYDKANNKLMVHAEYGQDKFRYSGEATAQDSFKKIIETYREKIGYHETLDHYNIAFGGGNMFEWAKNMSTNDKDIVFVLDPKAFADAGADVSKIEGWTFAQVEVKDAQGKPELVDKLLKPFDISK